VHQAAWSISVDQPGQRVSCAGKEQPGQCASCREGGSMKVGHRVGAQPAIQCRGSACHPVSGLSLPSRATSSSTSQSESFASSGPRIQCAHGLQAGPSSHFCHCLTRVLYPESRGITHCHPRALASPIATRERALGRDLVRASDSTLS